MIFFGSFLIAAWLLRLWLSGFAGLHPSEAYLWALSQDLRAFYSDAAPMIVHWIGWGQKFVELFVPDSTQQISQAFWLKIGLRLIPSFVSAVAVPLLIGRSIEWAQRSPLRITQMLLLTTTPAFLLGPQIVSPWIPLFLFWALGMVISLRLVRSKRGEAFQGDPTPFRPSWSVFFGLCLGLAFLSHSWAPWILVLFLLSGSGVANSLLALAVAAPIVVWQHNLVSPGSLSDFSQWIPRIWLANFNMEPSPLPAKHLADLWFTQFLLWSPFVFLGANYFPFRDLRNFFAAQRNSLLSGVLSLWAWLPLLLVTLVTLRTHQTPPWTTPCLMGAFVLVAARLKSDAGKMWWIILSHFSLIGLAGLVFLQGPKVAAMVESHSPKLSQQLTEPSRLLEFSGWKRFHTLAFEFTRSDSELELVVDDVGMLSELLFFDQTEREDRFGSRLKLSKDAAGNSHFHQARSPFRWEESISGETRFWFLQSSDRPLPKFKKFSCTRPQEFARDPEAKFTYKLYKCSAS